MSEAEQKKTITSLLLSAWVPDAKCESYLARCNALINDWRYADKIPALTCAEMSEGCSKCSFDFSSHLLSDRPYDLAVSGFMETYERFICDLLSIDPSIALQLSALLNVDPSLAVFELRSPRIPEAINAFRAFQFDYWVWHLPKDGEQDSA